MRVSNVLSLFIWGMAQTAASMMELSKMRSEMRPEFWELLTPSGEPQRRRLQGSASIIFRLFDAAKSSPGDSFPIRNLPDGTSFNLFVTGEELFIQASFFDPADFDKVPGSIEFVHTAGRSGPTRWVDNTEEFDLPFSRPFTGDHTLTAKAYSGDDASGDVLATQTIDFTVTNEGIPAIVEAFMVTAPDGMEVEDLSCPAGVCFYPYFYETEQSLSAFTYIAKVKAKVGSVKATMGRAFPGNGFNDLVILEETITNMPPYSLTGSDGMGLIPFTFNITSSNLLSFTAYSDSDATGDVGNTLDIVVVPSSCLFEVTDFDFCKDVNPSPDDCNEVYAFACPATCGLCSNSGGAGGDPHFNLWSGSWFDFHGICDLVLLQTPLFANGKGLTIHIRTKERYEYSYIESAAIRIGNDILEVSSWGEYWLNGVEGAELSVMDGDLPLVHTMANKKRHRFVIKTNINGESIVVHTVKDMVNVKVENATSANFGSSVGLMGSFVGGNLVGRDGVVMEQEDYNLFGQNWQVLETEPKLFQSPSDKPYGTCVPPSATGRRRLGERVPMEAAQKACAHLEEEQMRAMCVFDVMAMGDLEIAEGPGAF